MAKPADNAPKPARGSAMDRLRQDLAKKAKVPGAPPDQGPTEPKPQATPADQSPASATDAPQAPDPKADSGSTEPESPGQAAVPDAAAPKSGKANPWKLVDTYKNRIGELEKQIAEAKTTALAERERKELTEQIEKFKKDNEELANEIRYVNYTKHPEFKSKYQEPYEAAWKRAVSELSEIPVTDPGTNETRAATPEDLLALVNLPLGKAREIANQTFGDFADDVMAHRKEIKTLFDKQQEALENERKNGAEREKTMREQRESARMAAAKSVEEIFTKENSEVLKHPQLGRFFTPAEGDEEGNTKLQKGFELVDAAFATNPMDPALTPEERVSAVRRHVALRNRAAAFGKLTHMVAKLEAEKAELAKQLQQFKASTPPAGAQPTGSQASVPQSARDSVFAALRAKAH